jgi:opacity protein-like surface antigen
MKKYLLTALMTSMLVSANAKAEGTYVQLSGYGVELNDIDDGSGYDIDTQTGFGVGVSVGTKISNNFRAEAEVVVRKNEYDTTVSGIPLGTEEYYSQALMLNAIADIPVSTSVTPYIGVGLGVNAGGEELGLSDAVYDLGYQGMAGVSVGLTKSTSLVLGYKYFAVNDTEVKTHNLEAGLRFGF